jgi:hypothetical protein
MIPVAINRWEFDGEGLSGRSTVFASMRRWSLSSGPPFDHDRLSGAITLKTMKSTERYRPFGQSIRK